MDIKKLEILEKATQVFLKFGIKSVTMDDMARELVMSKKTLYTFFSDKNDLVKQIITLKTEFDAHQCSFVKNDTPNAIAELFAVSAFAAQMMKNIHPSVFYDLKKFHPEASLILKNHKWNFVKQSITENIIRGKKEGIYRKEIDEDVLSALFVTSTDLISDTEVFADSKLSSDQIFMEIMTFQIHGMANEKGMEILNTIKQTSKNT